MVGWWLDVYHKKALTETMSPYFFANSVNLMEQCERGNRPCKVSLGTHLKWALVIGNWWIFPRNGSVGGPGGSPVSRLPHFAVLRRTHPSRKAIAAVQDWTEESGSIVRRRSGSEKHAEGNFASYFKHVKKEGSETE